ncbi:MAG: lipoprotein insertase outer membrane protein LolB [Proteobacteria bacterium]|nr:lipoprotein insertase outer membrane protein LolB [Pseudomonadota bacterium]
MLTAVLPFITVYPNRDSRVRLIRLLSFPGLLSLLIACTSMPPPAVENSSWVVHRDQLQQLDSWLLRGRVNVRYDEESHTPRIQWQQQQQDYNIRLWGTFNAGNTTIDGSPGFVTMETDGNVLTASSPEDLILEQLGYELPVSYLEYWIKGLPAPASSAELSFNALNQLSRMYQDGWTISYTDLRQYGAITLPRRVEVTRPRNDIRLRFVGLVWTIDEDANGTPNEARN